MIRIICDKNNMNNYKTTVYIHGWRSGGVKKIPAQVTLFQQENSKRMFGDRNIVLGQRAYLCASSVLLTLALKTHFIHTGSPPQLNCSSSSMYSTRYDEMRGNALSFLIVFFVLLSLHIKYKIIVMTITMKIR